MPKNMGTWDRGLRFAAPILIAVLYVTGVLSGPVAIVLILVAVAFLATSVAGTCPPYMPFRFSTRRTN